MMKILEFVTSLLPKINKSRLQEDLNITRNEFQNVVIPSYNAASSVLTKLSSPAAAEFERQWATFAKGAKRGPLIASIKEQLEGILPTLQMLEEAVDKEFEIEIINAALTVQKATIIRLLEITSFTSTYALRFLNYIYIQELQTEVGPDKEVASRMSPAETALIEKHFIEFCIAISALSRGSNEIEKTLKSVPEVLVNARGEAALKVFGDSKVDPAGIFKVKGFTGNLIYRIGMMVAEIQANRYKRNKELKSILELRLLNLQQQRAGQADATLEREIELVQSRIESLDEKIRRAEESV